MIATTRLPYESTKAYNAFRVYAEMGDKRSLRAVGQKLGKSTTIIERWSSKWKWRERIGTMQVIDHEQYLAATAQAKLENARALEALRMDVRNCAWSMYEKLMAKAEALLKLPIMRTIKSRGKVIKKPTNPSYYTAAARLALVADPLGRFAADMPVTRVSSSAKSGKLLNTMSPIIHNVIIRESEKSREARKQF